MKLIILMCIGIWLSVQVMAQRNNITGTVLVEEGHGQLAPVPFVNIYWDGTTTGTVTDGKGKFNLPLHPDGGLRLVVSYIGHNADTITIEKGQANVAIILTGSRSIDEVTIRSGLGSTYISRLLPLKTEVITTGGLQRLACCNLSESFENSATVDVGYSDAVTGAKHIQMLGLAGVYSQILSENIPSTRGLGSTYGLTYIPGSWMESIQISKGTSSVINGYESTTGQINIEYKKAESSEPLFLNIYASDKLRTEANITTAHQLNEHWYTMLLAHGSRLNHPFDENGDSFMTSPLINQVNVYNRWRYDLHDKMESQIGVKFMYENREGGQMKTADNAGNNNNGLPNLSNLYKIGIDTRNFNAYTKTGFVLPSKPEQNIGFVFSGTLHEQDAYFGNNVYEGSQLSFFGNIIFQSIIGNTNHKYKTGVSLVADEFSEEFNESVFSRTEVVPGTFFEYNYNHFDRFKIIAGIRSDYNNIHGLILTPRFHFRYNAGEHTVIRGSAGKGYRSVNILAENTGILASSRQLVFLEDPGLEEAWNYGINITREFALPDQRKITWSIDYYRTDFQNQFIVDMDQDLRSVYFYNLDGKSYSNSFQTDLIIEPLQRFEITSAFRLNDVKMTINDELVDKPFVSKYKGLLTFSYKTPFDIWQFDLTNQFNGSSRLPDTSNNPENYQRPGNSPAHYIMHAQVTRRFRAFEVYLGGENLTGYTQKDPIIAADDPFGEYFDTSMVWGPLMGRIFYVGMRFTIE